MNLMEAMNAVMEGKVVQPELKRAFNHDFAYRIANNRQVECFYLSTGERAQEHHQAFCEMELKGEWRIVETAKKQDVGKLIKEVSERYASLNKHAEHHNGERCTELVVEAYVLAKKVEELTDAVKNLELV